MRWQLMSATTYKNNNYNDNNAKWKEQSRQQLATMMGGMAWCGKCQKSFAKMKS